MFIPYFIALFLGFVCPSQPNDYNSNQTVVTTSGNEAGDDGTSEEGPGTTGGGTGTGGGSTGGGSTGGGSTTGEGSQLPPPNP